MAISTHRLAVGIVAFACAGGRRLSAQAEWQSQCLEIKSSAVNPNGDVCTLAITVGREAYKALMKLPARRGQRATRPRATL